jgi:hypothetical protein
VQRQHDESRHQRPRADPKDRLRPRRIFTLLALILLIGPTILLAETLIVSAQELASDLRDGTVAIPVPPESIGQWPVIGQPLERFWRLASVNLEQALGEIGSELRALASWLLSTVAGVGLGSLPRIFTSG